MSRKAWLDWCDITHLEVRSGTDRIITQTDRQRALDRVGEPTKARWQPVDVRAGAQRDEARAKALADGHGFGQGLVLDKHLDELAEAFWHGAEPKLRPKPYGPPKPKHLRSRKP